MKPYKHRKSWSPKQRLISVGFTLRKDQIEELDAMAVFHELTASALVREAIDAYIKTQTEAVVEGLKMLQR